MAWAGDVCPHGLLRGRHQGSEGRWEVRRALSSRPFCPCDSRRVSLWDLSAGLRYTTVRTTNRYGCVTLHHSHFYVDQGVPQTAVLLWVSGEDLRAVYDEVLLADYHCHYNLRTGKVTHLRLRQWYPRPFAARQAQGARLERTPQDSVVVSRPPGGRRQAAGPLRVEQLGLFVWPQSA